MRADHPERATAASELVLRSERLSREGFAHGFSTRLGGVSAAPFDALNLGRAVGDSAEAVAENHRRLAMVVGYTVERLFEVSQVHGAAVRLVGPGDDALDVRGLEADALVGGGEGVAIGVRTADCTPVLVGDPGSGRVAAIHAGWRGVVAGVVRAGVDALLAASGAAPGRLVCAIGPCIRAESFEVSEDVARAIEEAALGERVIVPRSPRPHVDLVRAVVA
jgi:polyphenol oxidase